MKLVARHGATLQHMQDARNAHQLLTGELDAVRAMAGSWSIGLAGLLAAVLGFGLIRGRSDLERLDRGWAVAVAVLLGLVLLVGAYAAYRILGAAHGVPTPRPLRRGHRFDGRQGRPRTNHEIATSALDSLRRGMIATASALALLVLAVAITWFGPPREGLRISLIDGTGAPLCGAVKETSTGTITLQTSTSTVVVTLASAHSVRPVQSCPSPAVS